MILFFKILNINLMLFFFKIIIRIIKKKNPINNFKNIRQNKYECDTSGLDSEYLKYSGITFS